MNDLVQCSIGIDISHFLFFFELIDDFQRILLICLKALPDDIWRVVAPALLSPDFQSSQHLLLSAHQMKHKGAIRVTMCEFLPRKKVLQVTRKAINHKLPSPPRLHLVLKELDCDDARDNFSLVDDPTDGVAELRAWSLLLISQQLARREVPETEQPLNEGGLRALARPWPTQHKHHLESPHASIISHEESYREGPSHSILD